MNFLEWLKAKSFRRSDVPRDSQAELRLMRLERRRLLNGDFTFLAGLDLTLDNVDADLTIQETNADLQFILDSGQWTGTDQPGTITGNGSATLSLDKTAFNGLSNDTIVQARNATSLNLDSALPTLELGSTGGGLVINDFDNVNQVISDANFNDILINGADLISLNQVGADNLIFNADEIDFQGGANSIVGSEMTIAPSTGTTVILGGLTNATSALDFTDADIAALANGFSSISIGTPGTGVTGFIIVDSAGASFGDAVTLNAAATGVIRIDGMLDTTADFDLADITINGTGVGTRLGGDIITIGGSITINDGLLVDGSRAIDSTNFGTQPGGDVSVVGAIDGFNTGGIDELLINTVMGNADGINDGTVTLLSDVEGQAGSQTLVTGRDLERVELAGGSVNVENLNAGRIELTGDTLNLNGFDYISGSSLVFDGDVNLNSFDQIRFASGMGIGDQIVVTGSITDPGNDSELTIDAGAGSVDLQGNIATVFGLTIDDAARVDLADVTTDQFLVVFSDDIRLNGHNYTSSGFIRFAGPVNLASSGALSVSSGPGANDDIAFIGSIQDSANDSDLILNGGNSDVTLLSPIGNINSIGSLTVINAAEAEINSVAAVGPIRITSQVTSLDGSNLSSTVGEIHINGNVELTSSGTLTLQTGGGPGSDVTVTGTINDPGSNSRLTVDTGAAGNIDLLSDVGQLQPLAALTITNAAQAVLQNVTVVNQLAIRSTTTELHGLQYTSNNSSIEFGGTVSLTAPGLSTVVFRSGGDQSISVERIDGLDDSLRVESQGDVSIADVSFATGDLDVLIDVDDDGINSGTFGSLTADRITITGSAAGNDHVLLNGPVLADIDFELSDVESLAVNSRLSTNGTDVTLRVRDDVAFGPNGTINSAGGNILLIADDQTDGDGAFRMDEASSIDSGSGTITISATEDVVLSSVNTGNNSTDAVRITSSNGSVTGAGTGPHITAETAGAVTTVRVGSDIGVAGSDIFRSDGFVPLITSSAELDFIAGGNIVVRDVSTGPIFTRLDAAVGSSAKLWVQATGDIDVTNTLDIEAVDEVALMSDATIILPDGFTARRLLIDGNDVVAPGTISADDLVLRSQQSENLIVNVNRFDGTTFGDLSVNVANIPARPIELFDLDGDGRSIQTIGDGDINITASVTTNVSDEISAGGDGRVFLATNGVDSDLNVDAHIQTTSGDVTLQSDRHLNLLDDARVVTDSGPIRFISDFANGDLGGHVFMKDSSRVESSSGEISVAADGDITISSLQTMNSTGAAITLSTASGAVLDGGDSAIDIAANSPGAVTVIRSEFGVGSTDGLETLLDRLDIQNRVSGDIVISEFDDLGIDQILQQEDDSISIVSDGDLQVLAAGQGILIADGSSSAGPGEIRLASNAGDIVIDQTVVNRSVNQSSGITFDANGADSDIVVNAAVETIAGDIVLTSDDGIHLTTDGDLTAGLEGSVSLTSNTNGTTGDSLGDIIMSDGAFIDAVVGRISLVSLPGDRGDITLGGLFTANATKTAVFIKSAGAIFDGGDIHLDIDADRLGAATTIEALNGITSENALETSVDQLNLINSSSLDIDIFDVGDVDIFGITQTGDGDIRITAGGSVIVHAQGDGITILDGSPAAHGQQIELRALNGDVIIDQTIHIVGGDAGTGILFDAAGTNSDVIVNALVSNDEGRITISADDAVEFTAAGDVASMGSAGVVVESNATDSDGDSGDGILMHDGAVIDAGQGAIELRSLGVNAGSIVLGGLLTANATASAVLIQTSQSVVDGGDEDVDIHANQVGATTTVETVTGFGSANPIETQVDLLDIFNSTSGAIDLDEADDLRIVRLGQQQNDDIRVAVTGNVEVIAAGDGISIRDADAAATSAVIEIGTRQGSIFVNQIIENLSDNAGSHLTLDANAANSDVEVNATVDTVTGDIRFVADDRILLTSTGDTTAGTSGNVVLVANDDNANGDSGDGIVMADGTIIDSRSGTISLSAIGTDGGNIGLGSLTTLNSTADAITIRTSRGVSDSGDSDLEIIANAGGARTNIHATTGIGSDNAIETQIHELIATNQDGVVEATGNTKLIESDDLRLILLDNNADATATGDFVNGAVSVWAGGDLRVVDDGTAANATVQSENSIDLTAENISIDDNIEAIDDTAGVDGGIDERIEIFARGNFELLDNRRVSTDDDTTVRTVTPTVQTRDFVRITADADVNAPDADGDGVPDEGIVFFAETSRVQTDGGLANLFAQRPEDLVLTEDSIVPDMDDGNASIDVETAFYQVESIAVSELEFVEVSDDVGNIYQGQLTLRIGNVGEENLVLDIDWGDGRTMPGFANELDPNGDGEYFGNTDGDKNQFLIPVGGVEYVIPHRYSDFDISTNFPNQAGRSEASDALPVRFSVSHHVPSIEVTGRAIIDPTDVAQASPIVVPISDDISPLARLSSTDIVDIPTDDLPRFNNGITAFTVVTRSVPRALLQKEEIEIPSVKEIDPVPDPVIVDDAVVTDEVKTGGGTGSVGSEDFFQLRRRFADGTTEVIIKRISELEGDQLFDRDTFEEFVIEENLDDGSGYEIWLITSDPTGNVPVERPVFEFEVTAGKPGPASEELPDKLDEMRLVPVEPAAETDPEKIEESGDDDEAENRSSELNSQPAEDEAAPVNDVESQSNSSARSNDNEVEGNMATAAKVSAAAFAAKPKRLALMFSRRARAIRRLQQSTDAN